jgi:hypothetical protein
MYFRFESEFVEPDIKCIPMIVRFKLDACGVKLKLSEWSRMTGSERARFAGAPCTTPDEVRQYREDMRQLVLERTGSIVDEIPVEERPAWSNTDEIPGSIRDKLTENGPTMPLAQWQQLTPLQRFALVKLSRPSHESKNFMKALREFKLLR